MQKHTHTQIHTKNSCRAIIWENQSIRRKFAQTYTDTDTHQYGFKHAKKAFQLYPNSRKKFKYDFHGNFRPTDPMHIIINFIYCHLETFSILFALLMRYYRKTTDRKCLNRTQVEAINDVKNDYGCWSKEHRNKLHKIHFGSIWKSAQKCTKPTRQALF